MYISIDTTAYKKIDGQSFILQVYTNPFENKLEKSNTSEIHI